MEVSVETLARAGDVHVGCSGTEVMEHGRVGSWSWMEEDGGAFGDADVEAVVDVVVVVF